MAIKNRVINGITALAIGVGIYSGIDAINQYLAGDWVKLNEPIVGTVLAESYQNTLVPNPEFNGLISYSNETVKLDSKYTLKIRTDDGRIIGVSVIDGGTATKESLDALIEKGTRISFPRGNMISRNFAGIDLEETSFQDDTQMGTKRASRVQVLDK